MLTDDGKHIEVWVDTQTGAIVAAEKKQRAVRGPARSVASLFTQVLQHIRELVNPSKQGGEAMAQEKKEKDMTTVAPRRPAELLPRSDLEHWFDRMVEDFWRRPFPSLWRPERWGPAEGHAMRIPAVDVFEEKDDIVVKAELPGLSKEDLQAHVAGSTLTLKGEKKKQEEVRREDYYYAERSQGSFVRSLEMPCEVKADQVKATFKDGVLEIRLPKTEEAKKKAVTVKIE